jgi:hypothetical protein
MPAQPLESLQELIELALELPALLGMPCEQVNRFANSD